MMDNQQKQSPVFAEVNVRGEGQRQKEWQNAHKERFQYIKLSYPNGVTLTIPTEIGAEKLAEYIRIKI